MTATVETGLRNAGTPHRANTSLLLAASVALAGLGGVMVYSTTAPLSMGSWLPPHLWRHLAGLAIGMLGAAVAAWIPLRAWRAAALPLFVLAVLGLVAVQGAGVRVNGAQRWLPVPGLGVFQPGEFAKFAAVLAVAAILSRRGANDRLTRRHALLTLAVAAIPAGLLLAQPDFGNAALLVLLIGALLFVAGAPARWLALPTLGAGALGTAFVALHPYAWRRFVGFLDPWANAEGQGFQLVQSFVAFGRGGPFGVGLGYGRQKLHYLPEAHTDFVLSVVAEELGLLGVAAVLLGFALLLVVGLRIALAAQRRFTSLLAFGMTLLVVVPASVNAGVVMGLLPTKGLSLPLLSYGRSSLIVSCAALGLLFGIGRRQERETGARSTAT